MTLKPANYKYRPTEGTSLTGGKEMGYVHAEIELTNVGDVEQHYLGILPEDEIRRVTTTALVDTGAWDLVINEEIQQRLDLRVVGKQPVKLADETVVEVDIVGPVAIRFEDRSTFMSAIGFRTRRSTSGEFPASRAPAPRRTTASGWFSKFEV